MFKMFMKVLGVIGSILIIVFSIFMLVIASGKFGYKVYIVDSESMYSTYGVGAFILCREVEISEIKVEDVIVFVSTGTGGKGIPVTHRVIDINNENGLALTTKGDNNNIADSTPVTSENFDSKVIMGINSLGYIFKSMKETAFIGGVVVLIVLLLGLPQLDEILNR